MAYLIFASVIFYLAFIVLILVFHNNHKAFAELSTAIIGVLVTFFLIFSPAFIEWSYFGNSKVAQVNEKGYGKKSSLGILCYYNCINYSQEYVGRFSFQADPKSSNIFFSVTAKVVFENTFLNFLAKELREEPSFQSHLAGSIFWTDKIVKRELHFILIEFAKTKKQEIASFEDFQNEGERKRFFNLLDSFVEPKLEELGLRFVDFSNELK